MLLTSARGDSTQIATAPPAADAEVEVLLYKQEERLFVSVDGTDPTDITALVGSDRLSQFDIAAYSCPMGVSATIKRPRHAEPRPHTEARPSPAPAAIPSPATVAAISVVVPNYNYAQFLPDRLRSIFAQTIRPAEIILLDDGSTDASVAVAAAVAREAEVDIQIIVGAAPGGNPFRQWRKGLAFARGDYVWIAEADDVSEPTFLERTFALIRDRTAMPLAFCDSFEVDAAGNRADTDFKAYYSALGFHGMDQDAIFDAETFLSRVLFPRNLLINASAILWRKAALLQSFGSAELDPCSFMCAGDWRIYAEASRHGDEFGYISEPLNGFRHHGNSVRARIPPDMLLREILDIHDLIRRRAKGALDDAAADAHISHLRGAWGIAADRPAAS